MTVIELNKITKSFGDKLLLQIDNLKINEKEKIGIVGQNGSGKTTFLNIIAGNEKQDTGTIQVKQQLTYIKQFEEIEKQDSNLSGGEKTRKVWNQKFKMDVPILLADEPSNHLDIHRLQELENRLKKYQGTLLIISHDRNLLNAVCDTILEIENQTVTKYNGNYSYYQEQKQKEQAKKQAEYYQYQEEKARLTKSIIITSNTAKGMKKAPSRMGNSEARLHKREAEEIKEKLEGHTKALQTRLEKLEAKEKPNAPPILHMKSNVTKKVKSKYVITGEKVTIAFGTKVVIENSSFHLLTNQKTALLGDNGSGKTSLVRYILEQKQGIRVNEQVKYGYFSQELETLNAGQTVLENVLKESVQSEIVVRNVLGRLLLKEKDVFKKVEVLSGGEKVKVAIAKLLVANYNVLILDEPTNFLDVYSLEALQKLLIEYTGTILLISHDRELIRKVANYLWSIQDKKLTEFDGNYEQYLHTKQTKNTSTLSGNERLLIEMKITSIVSQLAITKDEQEIEKLEAEYQALLERKNNMPRY